MWAGYSQHSTVCRLAWIAHSGPCISGVAARTPTCGLLYPTRRQGLKAYSNWPTYPQLYLMGELVGGCDIVTEMAASGELQQLLNEKLGTPQALPAQQQQVGQGSGF